MGCGEGGGDGELQIPRSVIQDVFSEFILHGFAFTSIFSLYVRGIRKHFIRIQHTVVFSIVNISSYVSIIHNTHTWLKYLQTH